MASSKKPVKAAKPVKSKPKAASSRTAGPAKVKPKSKAPDIAQADPSLFDPLTPGEIADALRTLTEDRRLSGASVDPTAVPNWWMPSTL